MPTRRGAPVLKRLRYYLSQLPPENVVPHKKLNASSRAVLDTKSLGEEGLGAALEDVQQHMLYKWLRLKARTGQL